MAMDSTMKTILLSVGALVSFIFTILVYAFGTDIALYTMAVKNDLFWESEYGYTDWNETSESGSTESAYHEQANEIETDVLETFDDVTLVVTLVGSLITLVLVVLVFFRKDGGLIYMFRGVGGTQ